MRLLSTEQKYWGLIDFKQQLWGKKSQVFDLEHSNSSVLLMETDKQLENKPVAFNGGTTDQTVSD